MCLVVVIISVINHHSRFSGEIDLQRSGVVHRRRRGDGTVTAAAAAAGTTINWCGVSRTTAGADINDVHAAATATRFTFFSFRLPATASTATAATVVTATAATVVTATAATVVCFVLLSIVLYVCSSSPVSVGGVCLVRQQRESVRDAFGLVQRILDHLSPNLIVIR